MKVNKLLAAIFSIMLVFTACETEDSLEITSPEAALELLQPGVSNINLNFNLPDNPAMTIVWNDNLTSGASGYTVELAQNFLFENPTVIGTSDSDRFTLSVNEFNTVVLNAGGDAFDPFVVYLRVSAEGAVSNIVSFSVSAYSEAPPVINSPTDSSSFAPDQDTPDDIITTFDWTDPDFGSNSSVSVEYELQFAAAGTDFQEIIAENTGSDTSLELTHEQLNSIAVTAGIDAMTTGSLDVRIMATITMNGGNMVRMSEVVTIDVTTYNAGFAPVSWGIIGSGYNDWGNGGPDGTFYSTDTPNVFVAYETLLNGEIKFRENNDWGSNLGDNGADGTLESEGANIAVTEGTYKITLDLSTSLGTYSIEPFSLGVVGSGFNDWGNAGDDAKFYYDNLTDTFKVSTKLLDGEIKFRINNDWGTNYGGSGGTLAQEGANIPSTAGHYLITVDLNNNSYSIVEDDVLGIIGSGFNEWGDAGDDFELTEIQPDILVGDIVTLVDGEIKFRYNNAWDNDFGDNGADGTLDPGGANIAVTAGLYRVRLDLVAGTYVLNKIQ
ncbi:MAG: SusE domain-containing protein [Bacteroidota bacterium]